MGGRDEEVGIVVGDLEVVGAALLGLGGGKRIPCVGMREGAFPALFFGFIILFGIFLLGLTAESSPSSSFQAA